MADEAELQAKIVALAGAINRHKQQHQQPQPAPASQHAQTQQQYNPAPSYRGNYQSGGSRWAPFPAPRGRGRGGYGAPFQNRTLVNATTGATPPTPTPPHRTPQFQQQDYPNQQERNMTVQRSIAPPANRDMVIEGVRFQLLEDGSKLIRMTELSETAPPTPKKAIVAGVEFLRTKNNNLLRRPIDNVASKPASKPVPQCEHYIKNGIFIESTSSNRARQTGPIYQPTSTVGVCPFGIRCRFDHNPNKVSMCKPFFRNGTCAEGELCDLSHKPTYNRVPACTHFIHGNCTNDACRYAHVSPSPGPLICRPFALLGYCEKGVECDKRHVFECPDFAETGDCTNEKCKLQHTRHAHVDRQKARADEDSEVEDDEEVDGIESDDLDVKVAMSGGLNEIAQNQDFISFS